MKLITVPVKLLLWLVTFPLKVLLAALGLTFRTGFRAGTLPVKGGWRAGRSLGPKALLLFAAGVALGVVVGRRLGSAGAELAEASYGGYDGSAMGGGGPVAVTTSVEDTLAVVDTPDGPHIALVEDTIEVVDTPDGALVTETVTVTDLDGAATAEAEAEQELEEELEAEIDRALGNTGGELGVDADEAR